MLYHRNRRGLLGRWEFVGIVTAVALALGMAVDRAHSAEAPQNPASPVAQAAKVLELTGCPKPPQKPHKRLKAKPKAWLIPPPCVVPPASALPVDIIPPEILPYYVPMPAAPASELSLPYIEPSVPPPQAGGPSYWDFAAPYMGGGFSGGSFASGAVSVSVTNQAAALPAYKPPVITIVNNVSAHASAAASASASASASAAVVVNLPPVHYFPPHANKAPELDARGVVPFALLLFGTLAVARGRRHV